MSTASGHRTVLRLTTDDRAVEAARPAVAGTITGGASSNAGSHASSVRLRASHDGRGRDDGESRDPRGLHAGVKRHPVLRSHPEPATSTASAATTTDDKLRDVFDRQKAWQIAAENHAASGLRGGDVRWLVAARAAGALEGGRSAIIRPDRRREIVSLAGELGLKPFDANLVIAIVQDAARCGERLLGAETRDRVAMVRPADAGMLDGASTSGSRARGISMGTIWRIALLLASVAMFAVVWGMRQQG